MSANEESQARTQQDGNGKDGWEARRVRVREMEIGPTDPSEDFAKAVGEMIADAGNEVGGRPCVVKVTVEATSGKLKRPEEDLDDGE